MRLIFISFLIFNSIFLFSQEIINLQNPSFEDIPISGRTPAGWTNCGDKKHSPPDIHPDFTQPIFGVKKDPYEGKTYVGLVVRDDNTNDALGQKLAVPIQGKQCYVINMFLSKSIDYESVSSKTGKFTYYKKPVRIILWGGYEDCNKQEMLAQSPPIENLDWLDFQFFFQPTKTFTHITLEAYYVGNDGIAYNGNVLVDYISPIIAADCSTGKETAKPENRIVKKEEIQMPRRTPLANLESLKSLISEKGKDIIFHEGSFELTKAGKAALLRIADAKLDFGRYRLGIILKGNSKEDNAEQERIIRLILSKNKIPSSAYRFLEFKNKSEFIGENEILGLTLIDRMKG